MRAGRREAVTFGAPNSSRTASAIRCSHSRLTWPRFARPIIIIWEASLFTALNPTGTCSRGRRKYHRQHMFFSLRCLDDLEKFMSTWSEFPWNYQGETSFSIEESTNSRLRKLFMSSQWPLFFFSSFLVFEGFAYIYGFLITWGTPF